MRVAGALSRLALLAVGAVLSLLLVEAVLQVGAVVLRASGQERPDSWLTGKRRILCVGDSNTYGVWVERDEAFPSRLEARWNEAGSGSEIEVINLGYPGTNSSVLLSEFPRALGIFVPDLVIAMVGVNDIWTQPASIDATPGPDLASRLRRHSRTYRLYALLRSRIFAPDDVEVTVDNSMDGGFGSARYGDQEIRLEWERRHDPGAGFEADRTAPANLGRLVATARAHGAELVLMTYPSQHPWYKLANGWTREAARASGVQLVDLEEAFAPSCPEGVCPELIFENQHPARTGHDRIAEILVGELGSEKDAGR